MLALAAPGCAPSADMAAPAPPPLAAGADSSLTTALDGFVIGSFDANQDERGPIGAPSGTPHPQGGEPSPMDAEVEAASEPPRRHADAQPAHADAATNAPVDAGSAEGGAIAPEAAALLCPDGFERGDASLALKRVAAFTPSPEGVTVCRDGEVFVSVDGPDEIRRVPLDGGTPERYALLSGVQPAGIACDAQGRLFVAGFSRRDGSAPPSILMVEGRDAAARELPQPAGTRVVGLNGIVAVRDVGVFASDGTAGILLHARELPDGGFETKVAARDLLSANGLSYQPSTRKLYLVLSLLPPRVVSFEVGADGALGARREEASGELLTGYDGVAVDSASTLYVADYFGGAVLRARDRVVLAKLSDPASLAFRGGTLLVTSYHLGNTRAEGGLYALQLGACAELPSAHAAR